MSRVKRLCVRGIRNFSDEKDSTTIQFSRPMTLILGPNGTGKTTIIESLRFATTGDFPPGTDNGKCFIYDPKLTNAPTVRGVVKAEIIAKNGDLVVVSRTVECMQLPKYIKMKSLDSTVTRINSVTKKKSSVGGRCADITVEIVRAMGVSKAIINYVLFCHQEELNWPFEEGKKLKEKFDEIFGTTKFNKALDNLRSIIKAQTALSKLMKAEKETFFVLVNEVKERENHIKNLTERKEKSAERSKRILEELEPIQRKIKEFETKECEYKKIEINEDKKKMEYNLAKKEVESLKSNIHKIYEGTTDQLKIDLEVYEDYLVTKKNDIKEFESKLQVEAMKEQKLTNDIAEQRVQIGTLKQKMQDHNSRITNRNTMLQNTLASLKTNIQTNDRSENEINEFMKTLRDKIEELEHEAENARRQKELQEQGLQKEIDVLRTKKSKIDSETNMRDKEWIDIRKQITIVQSKIKEAGVAGKRLSEIEDKLREVNNKCDALAKKMDVNVTKTKINNEIKSRNEIEEQMHKLDEEISLMHQHSSLQAELDLYKSSLQSKEENVQSIKKKHESNIKTLLKVDKVPMRKLRDTLDEVYQNLIKEKDNYTLKLEREKVTQTTLAASLKHHEIDLNQKEDELKNDKAMVSAYCDYENYDDVVLEQLKKVKALQDNRGMYAYQGVAFKKYLEKVEARDPCCPLCDRGFQNSQEAKNLSQKMKNEMQTMPQVLKECETKLKVEQQKYDTLLQLKPTVKKILQFEENDLIKCREIIEEKTKKLGMTRQKLNEIRSAIKEPEDMLVIWKKVSSDIVLWDQSFDDIEKINRQIEAVKRQISRAGSNFGKTMEEAQKERNSLKNSMKDCRDRIETMQAALNSHCDKLEKAKEERLKLQEDKLELSSNEQKLDQFVEKEKELSKKEDELEKTIQQLKEQLVTAGEELETAIQKLAKTRRDNHESLKNDRQHLDKVSKRMYELNKTQEEIESFVESNIAEKLQRVEEKIKTYDDMINTSKNIKSGLEKKIARIREDMMQEELSKRTLMDNITLRKKEGELESLKKQWDHLKECIQNFQFEKISASRKALEGEEEKLISEKNIIEGTQVELNRNIKQLERELVHNKNYKNANANFKNKALELVTTLDTIDNLKAYSKILDASMIDYHEERMQTVNKIMDRLWRKVYTGHDTSTIQIRTSATEGVDTARRIYNYKLIQKKNGVEMDMKGRCSAGQRVLTSIIIRMALAETFCGDCGVMALDEPTTNLDEANSRSLAEALCQIVQQRSQVQKSFQLIVISHDEPFITRLSQANSHKAYYQLKRGPDGRSLIELRDMGGNTLAKPLATLDESSDEDDDAVDTVRV